MRTAPKVLESHAKDPLKSMPLKESLGSVFQPVLQAVIKLSNSMLLDIGSENRWVLAQHLIPSLTSYPEK